MPTTPFIRAIVLAIEVATDPRQPATPAVSRIAAAGIRTDPAGKQYEPPRRLYTTEVEHGQARTGPEPLPLPQALDALCDAARAFRPELVVTHGTAFPDRHLPGLTERLTPADPRPACTRRLARQLWPAAPEFEVERLCTWREILLDEREHPDFPNRSNAFFLRTIHARWYEAALGAALFDDICCAMADAGMPVTPAVLRERSHVQLQLRVPFGRHAGRPWADVPLQHCRELLHDDQSGGGRRLDPVAAATLEAALCGVYATGPRPDEPDPR